MSRADELEDVRLLLIDGDNLLHRVRGSRDEGGVAWLLPRLSEWRPRHLHIVIALDGHAPPGETIRGRAASGIEFRHSGPRSADDMLVEMLSARPYSERSRTIVVTRDADLRARIRRSGGLVRTPDWLMSGLGSGHAGSGRAIGGRAVGTQADGPTYAGIGQGRPPRRPGRRGPTDEEPDGAWRPGRGATSKRGNPRRNPKRTRRR
jgi:hypothetical protein